MKRKLAVLCALFLGCLICIIPLRAQSAPEDRGDRVFSAYEIASGLVPGYSVEPGQRTGAIVCVMRLYSESPEGLSWLRSGDFGHTFLTFLNTSASDITVGRHTVEPGKMVSIGKFGKFEGYQGAFYNAETGRKARFGWYADAKSVYLELTEDQLQTVSDYLKKHLEGYTIVGDNCAYYAAKAWNSVLSPGDARYIDHFSTPASVCQDLEEMENCLVGNSLLQADYELCYYDGTALVTCEDYF